LKISFLWVGGILAATKSGEIAAKAPPTFLEHNSFPDYPLVSANCLFSKAKLF
jgi:hypothetical protein